MENAADFYQRFESLGANCEFGLVQRRHGAEPLGLLRWPAITLPGILACLKNEFSELDDISNFSLFPGPHDDWDIMTPHFSLHLYAKIGTVDEDTLLRSAFRRIQFMRRNLLENLEDAEKIFVFKEWQFRMSDTDITDIFNALRVYNTENRLLAVRLTRLGDPAGSVSEVSEGLWSGYVEWDEKIASEETVPFQSWERICQTVTGSSASP